MPSSDSQLFLRELDKKLWNAADRLRSNLGVVLEAVEKENTRNGDLRIASFSFPIRRSPLPNLVGLIDLIATSPLQHVTCPGKVKRRRTPKSIVSLIVEMIEPYQSRVYDPAMGSGNYVGSKRAANVSPTYRPASSRVVSKRRVSWPPFSTNFSAIFPKSRPRSDHGCSFFPLAHTHTVCLPKNTVGALLSVFACLPFQ